MGLPDPGSARTWGGKLLVDRDGAEIGTCTEIFLDDATGMPEWATADVAGGPAFVPLIDAVESGPQVRVAVRRVDVADAPSVGDVRHLSEDEEERLYRHYGIEYSQAASDSGLPADAAPSPPTPVPPVSSISSASSDPGTTPEGGPIGEVPSGQPAADAYEAAETVETASSGPPQARRILLLGLGLVTALGAIAAVLRSRRHPQPPPTRAERLAARARSVSLGLDTRSRQAIASAAPVLQTGRRVSLAAAQQAALQAAAAAEQASALAARAQAIRLPHASPADEITQSTPTMGAAGTGRRSKAAAVLESAISFGAGYLLGSAAGRARIDQIKQATGTWVQRPGVQQARSRLGAGVTDTLHAGTTRLTQSTAAVAGRFGRRASGDDASPAPGDDYGNTAADNGRSANSPHDR
jgi:hypothetical protein